MVNINYANAYKEVLIVINNLVKENKKDKAKTVVKILFALGIMYNVYKTFKIVKNGIAIIKDMWYTIKEVRVKERVGRPALSFILACLDMKGR